MARRIIIGTVVSGDPAWRSGLSAGTIAEIPNTAASLVNASRFPWPSPNYSSDEGGPLEGWQSVATLDGIIYSLAAAGHGSWQNQVIRFNLNDASPSWDLHAPATPTAMDTHCSIFTSVALPDVDNVIPYSSHFVDGRPTGRHTYYASCGVRASKSNNGNPYGVLVTGYSGGFFQGDAQGANGTNLYNYPTRPDLYFNTNHVDAVNLSTKIWESVDTWPPVSYTQFGQTDPNDRGFFDWGTNICQHPVTDDIYVRRGDPQKLAVLDVSAATLAWSYPAFTTGPALESWRGFPMLIDASRNRLVAAARHPWVDIDISTDNFYLDFVSLSDYSTSSLQVTGLSIPTWTNNNSATRYGLNYAGFVHDLDNDRYLLMQKYDYNAFGNGSTVRLYAIDPDSGVMSLLLTTQGVKGDDGVIGKFKYIQSLGGCVWFPSFTHNMFFFPTR